MAKASPKVERGDITREALIQAAIEIFGRDGFHAASTRAIAERAGANQALIGYHFRGKLGLYLAAFEYIIGQIAARIGPIVDRIADELAQQRPTKEARERAVSGAVEMASGMIDLLTQSRSELWAQMILREQQAPTAAFDILYNGLMGRALRILTELIHRAKPLGPEVDARLLAFTLIGQVLVFRTARAGLMRHMGWTRIGDRERVQIQNVVRRNFMMLLDPGEASHDD
jgi:AcrR family transcriptional regulator